MNLLDQIRTDPVLSRYIIPECTENGICIDFAPEIAPSDYVIIAVDAFYNECLDYKDPKSNLMYAPASVDCLIVLRCSANERYRVLLVELKNVGLRPSKTNMKDKFENTLKNFMVERFHQYFYSPDHEIYVELYLRAAKVSDSRVMQSLNPDYFLGFSFFKFGNKLLQLLEAPELVTPC